MTVPQIAEALTWMQGALFPKWESLSDIQVEEWAKHLKPFSREQFETAAREHYLDQGNYKSPVLKDLVNKCWEVRRRCEAKSGPAEPFTSLAEIVRKAVPNLQAMPDWEVTLRYYRMLWIVKARRQEQYREGLRQQCYNSLCAMGMAAESDGQVDFSAAQRAADSIFEDAWLFSEAVQDISHNCGFIQPAEQEVS